MMPRDMTLVEVGDRSGEVLVEILTVLQLVGIARLLDVRRLHRPGEKGEFLRLKVEWNTPQQAHQWEAEKVSMCHFRFCSKHMGCLEQLSRLQSTMFICKF